MEPTPLDYAPPPTRRRGVFVAGLLAHVIASYVVGVGFMALRTYVNGPPPVGALVGVALAPLWVPIGFILVMLLAGRVTLTPAAVICSYTGLLAFDYWRLRKPRGT